MIDGNVNVGDKIVTSMPFSGTKEIELEVTQTGLTEGYFNFLVAEDEEGNTYEIPYGYFEKVEEESKPEQNIIKAEKWIVGQTFIVPKDRDNGTQAPFYPIIDKLEEGVTFIDDNGFTQTRLFRNVEKVNPYDTHERVIELASSLAKLRREVNEKFNEAGKALLG